MKILIADTDNLARRRLEETLNDIDYEVISCRDGKMAWETIESDESIRLLMLDHTIDGMNGIEICKRVRQLKRKVYVYVVMLTSRSSKEDIMNAMRAGVDDYIIKPFYPLEMSARLRAGKRIIKLHESLLKANLTNGASSAYDSLTGVKSQKEALKALQKELHRTKRDKKPLSVILLAIDDFKNLLEARGKLAGDQVLQETSGRILSVFRVYDEVGRYGENAFMIIMPGCAPGNAAKMAEKLRAAICETPIETSEGNIKVTASLGVGICENDNEYEVNYVVKNAIKALKRAKAAGSNRVEVEDVSQMEDKSAIS